MGQPKHRTSKSKTRHRRSHHGADLPSLVYNTETNQLTRPHFIERRKKRKELVNAETVTQVEDTQPIEPDNDTKDNNKEKSE